MTAEVRIRGDASEVKQTTQEAAADLDKLVREARRVNAQAQSATAGMDHLDASLKKTGADGLKVSEALKRVGLDSRALAQMPVAERMKTVSAALVQVKDSAERARLSETLLGAGRSAKIAETNIVSMLGKSAAGLTQLAAMFGVSLGVGAAIGGFSRMIDSLDNIGKAAARIGATTDELQGLEYAAQRGGATLEQMEVAVSTLSRRMDDAAGGNKTYIETFERLGLSAQTLMQMPLAQRMQTVASALAGVANEAERNAIAQDLFGESGRRLLPVLAELSGVMAEFKASGAMIDEADIRAAERYADAMTNLGKQLRAAAVDTGAVGGAANMAEGLAAAAQQVTGDNDKLRNTLDLLTEIGRQYIRMQTLGMVDIGDVSFSQDFGRADLGAGRAARRERQIQEDINIGLAARAAAASAAKEAEAEEAKRTEAAKKLADAVADQVRVLEERRAVQELLNQGLDREAAVLAALQSARARARSAGGELSPEQEAAIGAAATGEFDARQTRASQEVQEAAARGAGASIATVRSSLTSIGGARGREMMFATPSEIAQQSAKLQRQIELQEQIAENTAGGATWP